MTSFQSAGAPSSQDPDEEPDYLADCDLSDLLGMFREIEDTRGRNGRQHELGGLNRSKQIRPVDSRIPEAEALETLRSVS